MTETTVQILDQHGRPFASDTAHFAASRTARELRNWTPPTYSADSALVHEAPAIAARSHDLERNHGVAAGAIRTQVDNIVGTGLRLSARPDYRALGRTKEWADAWARDVEAKWRTFANVVEFDAARQLTFGGMTVMQLRAAMLTGDACAVPMWLTPQDRPGLRWSTAIQAIDSARLSNPMDLFDQAHLRGGVEINSFGEPIAYHVRAAHPGDQYIIPGDYYRWERIPARTSFGRRRFLHLYEKLQPGQSRGRGILTTVMGAFKMLDHYQRIELQTAVVNSMIAAFIETPLKADEIADLFGSSDKYMASRGNWDVKLEGAGIIPLHPGDKLNSFTPTRPNSAYSAFVEAVLRYISTGMNMPYELLMKDFSKTNYSSARAAMLEAWRYFTAMREWLATYWCGPIYELWLEEAIQRGEIEAPTFYEDRAAWTAAKWIGPGRGWVDPMKEAQAAQTRMDASLSTLEREAAEQGLDWEEVLEQRAREKAHAESLGLELHVPAPQGGAPNQAPAPDDGGDDTTGKPDTTDTEGSGKPADKGETE